MEQAYAVLHVKSFDATSRTFRGIATTPELDRQGHKVDPKGIKVTNPIPLLWHHDRLSPIGTATLGEPTDDGTPFDAQIPIVEEPGKLKDRCDEAIQTLDKGLIRGVSIGFTIPDMKAIKPLKGGGLLLKAIEVLELSLVTIPANMHATIHAIKSAASGENIPDVSGPERRNRTMPQSIREQITTWENKRAATVARMDALMQKSADTNETLNDADSTEYDDLETTLAEVDKHLTRLHMREKSELAHATAVAPVANPKDASAVRGGTSVVRVINLPPETAFLRYVIAKAAGMGSNSDAIAYAERFNDTTPEVQIALKAAVPPAGTITDTWAGALVPELLSTGFMEYLRPITLIGRIPGLYKVPFNVKVPMQTGGGIYTWVGQGAPKKVTQFTMGTATLGITKIAGIIAITDELARLSVPSAEQVVRNEMTKGIAAFMDQQFIDPAVAAQANLSPASITNGIAPIMTTGDALQDVNAILSAFAAANIPVDQVVLIMSSTNAFKLGVSVNALGQPQFPNLGPTGGNINGVPVIASNTAGTNMIGVVPGYILIADDGGVSIDVSREASVQMNDAPDNPPLATSLYTSFWQQNLIGIRAERYCNWKRAMDSAVQLITGAVYPASMPLATTTAKPASAKSA